MVLVFSITTVPSNYREILRIIVIERVECIRYRMWALIITLM